MVWRRKTDEEIKALFWAIEHKYNSDIVSQAWDIAEFLIDKMYSKTECSGLQEILELRENFAEEKKMVYLFAGRHLSECDWFDTQYSLLKYLSPALILMGNNLCVGPFGNIFRQLGGTVVIREDTTINGEEIDKQTGARVLAKYLEYLVENELGGKKEFRDLLFYPEVERISYMKGVKAGRSYNQKLLEFSAVLFRTFCQIQGNTGVPMAILPHNVSRERVVEDQIFSELSAMKERGCNNEERYMFDMGFILTHWIYQNPGAVALNFGAPMPVSEYKAKSLAEETRKRVAELQVFFPTHVVAYSIGDREEILLKELEHRVAESIENLAEAGLKLDCYKVDETIERARLQFTQPKELDKTEFEDKIMEAMESLKQKTGINIMETPFGAGMLNGAYEKLYRPREVLIFKDNKAVVNQPENLQPYNNNIISIADTLGKKLKKAV